MNTDDLKSFIEEGDVLLGTSPSDPKYGQFEYVFSGLLFNINLYLTHTNSKRGILSVLENPPINLPVKGKNICDKGSIAKYFQHHYLRHYRDFVKKHVADLEYWKKCWSLLGKLFPANFPPVFPQDLTEPSPIYEVSAVFDFQSAKAACVPRISTNRGVLEQFVYLDKFGMNIRRKLLFLEVEGPVDELVVARIHEFREEIFNRVSSFSRTVGSSRTSEEIRNVPVIYSS